MRNTNILIYFIIGFVFFSFNLTLHADEVKKQIIEHLDKDAENIIKSNSIFKDAVHTKTFDSNEQKEFYSDMTKYENHKLTSNEICQSNVIDYLLQHNLAGFRVSHKTKLNIYRTNKTSYKSNRTHSWTALSKVYDVYEVSVDFIAERCVTSCQERDLSMGNQNFKIPISCSSYPLLTVDLKSLKYKNIDKKEVLTSEKKDYGPIDEQDGSFKYY